MHKEIQELFDIALKDGLITDPRDLLQFRVNLLGATIRVEELRAEVYAIKSWQQDLAKWWQGLSGKLQVLCGDLDSIRTTLAIRNSKERKRLASQSLCAKLSSLSEQTVGEHTGPAGPLPRIAFDRSVTAVCDGACMDSHAGEHHHTTTLFPTSSTLETANKGGAYNGLAESAIVEKGCNGQVGSVEERHYDPSATRPEEHVVSVSDADLRRLIRLALIGPRRWFRHHHVIVSRASRRNGSRKRDALHSRFEPLLHLVRRMYGMHQALGDVGKTTGSQIAVDPESLAARIGGTNDFDNHSDAWEEA
ncbi:hypothetical protein BD414DRAFT_582064 [Trametes punicea]|nr:hypothetical protein BD414DRAFT_582064 [Trametes punicea]